ncbi:universal stress protein [Oryzihumus sp.]
MDTDETRQDPEPTGSSALVLPEHEHTQLCGAPDRVVVGVDDTALSREALWWAAREAMWHSSHLHVVHASEADEAQAEAAVRAMLDEVYQQVHLPPTTEDRAPAGPPVVEVEYLRARSRAPEALVAASHGAAVLVLGAHSSRRFAQLVTSVSHRAAAFATCPVAFVRPGQYQDPPAHARVVVGVDDTQTARDALRWAAREVSMRRGQTPQDWRLEVLHAAPAEQKFLLVHPRSAAQATERMTPPEQLLDYLRTEVLTGDAERDVPVDYTISYADPVGALVEAATGADLLVIGSSGRGILSDVLQPSVAREIVDRAPCPVVVAASTPEDRSARVREATVAEERASVTGPEPSSPS